MLEIALEHTLKQSTDPALFKQLLADSAEMPIQDQMLAYSSLARASTNPRLIAKYGDLLAKNYQQRCRTNVSDGKMNAAENCAAAAEILYDMLLALSSKPGLEASKRQYEIKLAEAQSEKARLSEMPPSFSVGVAKPSYSPSQLPKQTVSLAQTPVRHSPTASAISTLSVSPAVSARIGQTSLVSTPSITPSTVTPPMHSSTPTPPIPGTRSGYCPPSTPASQSTRASPISSIFSKEDALDELDALDCSNESTVLRFIKKCKQHGHAGVALLATESALEELLRNTNSSATVAQFLPSQIAKRDRMIAYGHLSLTSTNPQLVLKYAGLLGDGYMERAAAQAALKDSVAAVNCATNAEIAFNIALNLTSKPGLGSFRREYEAKLAEAQKEKARFSATSSSMSKPSIPLSTSSSSSGQPAPRTAPTSPFSPNPTISGGMPSTPPRPVPGRFPGTAPGPMSTSAPSSRPAPLPPPQGSFSAPTSGTAVRPGVVPSSSSSSTPTRVAESPLASPAPRLPSLHEFVSDLQRRPGLPGVDFLKAEDVKALKPLLLELVPSKKRDDLKHDIDYLIELYEKRNIDLWFVSKQYWEIASLLFYYKNDPDSSWLILFFSAAACNSDPEFRLEGNAHIANLYARKRNAGIGKWWTLETCRRICSRVPDDYETGITPDEWSDQVKINHQRVKLGIDIGNREAASMAASREASGLHHYRMMGTNAIRYGGYSNV